MRTNLSQSIAHSLFAFSRFPFVSGISVFTLGLGVLFCVSFLVNLWHISFVPTTTAHDELFYPVQAQSLAWSGRGLFGSWTPLSLTSEHPLYAEWPGVIMALGYLVPVDYQIRAHLVIALLGAGIPVLIGLLSYHLFRTRDLAFMTALLAATTPWIIQSSRLLYDPILSMFFYLLGTVLFLRVQGLKKIIALVPFVIGFFQYQGFKLLLVPLIMGLVWYQFAKQKKQPRNELLSMVVISLASLLLVAWFARTMSGQSAQMRSTDIALTNQTLISRQVDAQRLQVLPHRYLKYQVNKGVVLSQMLWEGFVKTFDARQWFVRTESIHNPNAVATFGFFLPVTGIFLFVGMWLLARDDASRVQGILIIWLLLISTIPQALNVTSSWIWWRSSWLIVPITLVAGVGFWHLWHQGKKVWGGRLLVSAVLAVSVVWFATDYVTIYPVSAATNPAWSEKVVTEYIRRLPPEQKVFVHANESFFAFLQYLYQGKKVNPRSVGVIQSAFHNQNYQLGNVTFFTACISAEELASGAVIFYDDTTQPCDTTTPLPPKTTLVKSVSGGHTGFVVHNDVLCGDFELQAQPNFRPFKSWSVVDTQEFCQNYLAPSL